MIVPMIHEDRYKDISKVVQILVTYYSKNKDRKNQMRCVYFQGALNEYMERETVDGSNLTEKQRQYASIFREGV